MTLIVFGFLLCVLAFSVKSETQCIEYDKIRDLVREEIQNFQDPKILKLEHKVMKMTEQLYRQEEHIQSQKTLIEEQQRYINIQEIQIQTHEKQINEAVEHISMLEGKSINEARQKQSDGGYEIKPWKQTEARDFGNISSHSFLDYALRQSIKSITEEKTRNKKERHSLTKRLELNDSIVAFYAYMSKDELQPGQNHILVFDDVKTNVGLAFNKHNGMFTAPVNGVYVFIWTVVCGRHNFNFSQLVINSNPFGAILTDSDGVDDIHTVTGSVVAELTQGDVVYIRTHPTDSIDGIIVSRADMHTSFNGWKL
ncbi:caprin-2-like [Mytilus trossulus]|uniref:caprin-2-like n=1 Tax=Mytilus trossulus TaxID=6551 RepID=UPI003004AD66